MSHIIESFYLLIEKFVQVPHPPIELLSHCVSVLSVVAKSKDPEGRSRAALVWDKLSTLGLFPYLSSSVCQSDINPGIVGGLLAQQECVDGEYPLTTSFLDLLLNCCSHCGSESILPSVLFVLREMLPSFQQWRFSQVSGKQVFGQKILKVAHTILSSNQDEELKSVVCQVLLTPAPCDTLLSLASTGDKTIQSLLEAQSNWDQGVGVELGKLVNMSLEILDILIQNQNDSEEFQRILSAQGSNCNLNSTSSSSTSGNPNNSSVKNKQPHFLLTIAHYIYHFQNSKIPISAIRLLETAATTFPMSLLACFGSEAEAFRDILIMRLESVTEDILLKIAIINFFSACVVAQPGLVQLLIGIKSNVQAIKVSEKLKPSEEKSNSEMELVTDNGCLKSILLVLNEEDGSNEELQMAVMNFIQNLWSHQRIVAVAYLKRQKDFWKTLSRPLFTSSSDNNLSEKKSKLIACIFRIISSEIFAFGGGKVDSGLSAVLEKFVDDKNSYLSEWFDKVLNNDLTGDSKYFLLGSWKTFLIILCRDSPVTMSPTQCNLTASRLISGLRGQLGNTNRDLRITTNLSETALILMKQWQTKCADKSMDQWIQVQAKMLDETVYSYDHLHPRTKSSILAIAHTALKISSFKMDKQIDVLISWLEPVSSLTLSSLNQVPNLLEISSGNETSEDVKISLQVPILATTLMRNLIQRFDKSGKWFNTWKETALTQSLLGVIQYCVKVQKCPCLVLAVFDLLIEVGKTEKGCETLLVSDLAQLVWLPLSNIKENIKEWIGVFQLSLQLANTLLRVGKQHAVDNSITVVALLQDQITSFVLAPKLSVDAIKDKHINLTVTAASFLALLSTYFKQWQLNHANSLLHFYKCINSLVHIGVCLLIRPTLLGSLVDHHEDSSKEISRARRISTTSTTDAEIENVSAETIGVQNRLLDAISSGLTMLRSFSPGFGVLGYG